MKIAALRAIVGLGLLSATGAVCAVQYTWDLGQLGVTTSALGGSLNFASTPAGQTLKVYAFETANTDGTGKLADAKVTADGSWGLGVLGSGDGSYPDNLTVDNAGKDEALVFDSGIDNFDWSSLKLGFIYSGTSGNIKYWAGNGTTGFDFNNYCLTGTCSGGTLMGASGSGFSSGTSLYNIGTATKTLTTGNTGRYLVVSGELPNGSSTFEKFKISSVGGQAPEPQSMALVAIGLIAMLGMGRRSTGTVRRRVGLGFA